MTENSQDLRSDSIAIVGMAGKFPGASSVWELWENLKNGADSSRTFTDEELLSGGVTKDLISNPRYVKKRSLLENVEEFDSDFFGITPREAECIDPQHRLFLECAWEALECSGYNPDQYPGLIGVFAGCGMNQYLLKNLVRNRRVMDSLNERQTQVFSDKDFMATRVAYKMNLRGPSLDIQTACSTSLVSIHIACQSLLDYQCDMALSGGAYIQLPRVGGFLHTDGDMRSPDGTCKTFDAKADGTVFGDGVGIVVLKRLEDAVEEKDTIYAVIRGTAINNDGANKVGYYAPSVEGQAAVIKMAQEAAEVEPETITYIEAHGTGTSLGDPIEVTALSRAFRTSTQKQNFCALGSLKPNIGHLDAASGVAGLIKTALALHFKTLPPTIHYNTPNPKLDLESSPFYIQTQLARWPSNSGPRRAAVSSFGVGGTNAHAVLEEAPESPIESPDSRTEIITLSARSEEALNEATRNLASFFKGNPQTPLGSAAYTLQAGRRSFDFRRVILANRSEEVPTRLTELPAGFSITSKKDNSNPPLVFMFTGQGSQYIEMGRGLYEKEPVFRKTMDTCFEILQGKLPANLRDVLYGNDEKISREKILNETRLTQPALFSLEFSLAKLWESLGITPDAMIGHSIGEYTAACLSGVFSLEDALKLVAIRGNLMYSMQTGAMLSIPLPENQVKEWVTDETEISVLNSPSSTVVSGTKEAIGVLHKQLQQENIRSTPLITSHGFHSFMMDPMLKDFKSAFAGISLKASVTPFISNQTGTWITKEQATSPDYWVGHLRNAVRFADGLKTLHQEGYGRFLEVGPGNTLCTLTRQSLMGAKPSPAPGISLFQSIRHPKQSVEDRDFWLLSVGGLWANGVEVDWQSLHPAESKTRIHLPTYPFQRKRHWVEPDEIQSDNPAASAFSEEQSEPASHTKATSIPSLSTAGDNTQVTHGVKKIWAELLGVDNPKGSDHFFDLGGDSVWASQALLRIKEFFGIDLNLKDIFDHPTFDDMVSLISSQVTSSNGRPKEADSIDYSKIDRTGPLPLSPAQQRLWFLSKLEPESPAFNLNFGISLSGVLDFEALTQSLHWVIKRHEPLRTHFQDTPHGISARISEETAFHINQIKADNTALGKERALAEMKTLSQVPFDLTKGPLVRWNLLEFSQEDHMLVYQVHHIVFDGWSMGRVLHDIGVAYDAFSRGNSPVEDALEKQFVDYAQWYNKWLETDAVRSQLNYWLKKLEGDLPVMQLPFDYQRPKSMKYTGSLECFNLSEELSHQVKEYVKQQGVTPFMFFLSVFKCLLYRYSGLEDIIVGTPSAGRNHMSNEKIIGFFINMLVLRSHVNHDMPFAKLLSEVKNTSLEAFSNPDVSFEKLVENLQPSRDLNTHPIYQTMFAYHNFDFQPIKAGELNMRHVMVDRGAAQVDYWLALWEEEGVFKGYVEYSEELFQRGTILKSISHFQTLLRSTLAAPESPVGKLPLLSSKEITQATRNFNETDAPYPKDKGIHHLISESTRQYPDKIAVRIGDQTLTYQELELKSNQLAHFLKDLGAGPETSVGMYLERSLDMVITLLGILKSRASYVPIDPMYPAERIGYMIEDAQLSIIVTEDKLEELLPSHEAVTICIDEDWEEISESSSSELEDPLDTESLAYIIFTSGSTGRPKGVQVPHRAVVNFLVSMQKKPGFGPEDNMLAVTTPSFDIHVLEIFLPLITGGTLVVAKAAEISDGEALLKLIKTQSISVMQGTPSTWRLLLAAGWEEETPVKVLCGGEPFPRDLVRPLLKRSTGLWNMYGPTETTVWSTVFEITDPEKPILVGKPIANTQTYILDKARNPIPLGATGELFIGGDGVTHGYLGKPELTQKQFIVDPFRPHSETPIYGTGDLARFLPDGNIECMGRIDHQVKIRGFRIELGEIETAMATFPQVEKAIATVRESKPGDVPGDARLCGYVVLKKGFDLNAASIRTHLKTLLPDYMIPQHFMALQAIPLTPAGKVDRKSLPAPEREPIKDTTGFTAPYNQIQRQMATIWENFLDVRPIGIQDNFFEIGGHSLLAVQLFTQIEKEMGERLPLALLYQAPTIELLSKSISSNNYKEAWSTIVPIQPKGSKLPLFLIHGAGGNVLLYRQLASYLGPEQPVFGLQAKGLGGNEPFLTRIEEMASAYIPEIMKMQSTGPYYLGGYCLGGTIAYEMARQLSFQGHKVGLVAMFDTYNGWKKAAPMQRLYHHIQRILFHYWNYKMVDKLGRKLFIQEKLLESRRRFILSINSKISGWLFKLGVRKEAPVIKLEDINDNAVYNFSPMPYNGKITVFKTLSAYKGYEDDQMGWGKGLVTTLNIEQLNVYPGGTMNEPFIKELAGKLENCISRYEG